MVGSGPAPAGQNLHHRKGSLTEMLREVHRARAVLRGARRTPDWERSHRARWQLVDSLTFYVDELVARGLPVPYQLRDELRINSTALSSRR